MNRIYVLLRFVKPASSLKFKYSTNHWSKFCYSSVQQLPTFTQKKDIIYTQKRTKVWTSSYPPIELVDHCIHAEITGTVKKHVENGINQPVLISAENPSHCYTYQQFLDVANSLEAFFLKHNFQRGDVVTTVLPNSIEYPAILLSTIGRSGIFSGASPKFTEYEIHRQLEDNGSKFVFTNESQLDKVISATSLLPSVKKIVCIRSTNNPLPNGILDWNDVIETPAGAALEQRHIHDVALLPYSSGTTGAPKGVQLTHMSFLTAVRGIKKHFEEIVAPSLFPSASNEELSNLIRNPQIHFIPFYHAYGQAVLVKNILLGCPLYIMQQFDPVQYLELIEKFKVWNLYLVPPVALLLAKDDQTKKYDLSSLRYAISAGAPLGPELGQTFMSKFPNVSLVQAFGMSETSLFPFLPSMKNPKGYGTVGKVAQKYEAKIVDIEDGKELNEGQDGEICVRGPGLMKGYLRITDTGDVFDKDGWFRTGDIGHFDENGELVIVDRLKELIKVKGLQVPPAELESVLSADPRIMDVAVIGVKHDEFGEVPKAFVVPADQSLTEDQVKQIVDGRLASYKRLQGGVEFVDVIPKSPSGKILRRQLRDRK